MPQAAHLSRLGDWLGSPAVVGISLLTLVPGVVGGSETYARELVRALARVGELDYRVFAPSIAPDIVDGLPGRTVTAYPASFTMPGRMAAMARAALFPGAIRRELELDRLQLVHFPLTVTLPATERPPVVSTLLDIQHVFFPRFFSRGERAYRKVFYGRAVHRSSLVITISEHVKETLVERMGADSERLRVVRLGIDHERFRPSYGPREPFLLYPANRWPHKNHDRLLQAFALVRRERPELRLVLTGSGHDRAEAGPGVEVRGRVSPKELVDLYARAAALVFPSLYEGFGQPPLEAMASGCPVAASTAGSLPEICGDAARYFDPTSVDEIAQAIVEVLDRPEELVGRGLTRAGQFNWDDCARGHEAVYRELGEAA
jgi:glycosyltransferase involved in cell wall biosynthesis